MQYKIFGCKTNKYFTEKWIASSYLQDKSGIFVASCIVTDKAKSKWIKFLKDSIGGFEKQEEKIYLSGCGTIKKGELVTDFFETYPELLTYKDRIELLGEDPAKTELDDKINKLKSASIYTRKYLVIQNGCDNHCTFCLTIQARGRHFSRDLQEILNEIKEAEKSGMKELVITGTNIGAWGTSNTKKFQETRFPELLDTIIKETSIPRIRISSLGIEYINENLLKILSNPRIYAHLHLSIQSGSYKILKLMNRNYTREALEAVLSNLNSIIRFDGLKYSLGADFIIGFPGELEEDFQDTLDIIERFNINKVHAFPFSTHTKSDFIPASSFGGKVDEKTKQSRMKKILKLGNFKNSEFLKSHSGKELNILLEKVSPNSWSGWSENYIPLNEKNFTPSGSYELKRGNIIKGTFLNLENCD